MSKRLDDLRRLAQDPDDAVLVERIERARTNIPPLSRYFLAPPGLFLIENNEIEARWVADDLIINVVFGSEIDFYIYDQSAERLLAETVVADMGGDCPAWAVIDAFEAIP